MGLLNRIKNAINVFMGADPPGADIVSYLPIGASYGGSSYYRPDRPYLSHRNERSIINSVYNRIAVDVASLEFREILVDSELRYTKDVDSTLSKCLTISGNKDQTGRQLMQDIVISLLDEGCVAVVPVDTDINPIKNDVFDIYSLRTGRILEWYPDAVKIYLYNDRLGKKQEVILPKKMVSIIENPFYSVMNEPNSTLRRLVKTLNLLDTVDEQSANGKLDLIIQLPYTVKSEARQKLADKRRSDIEAQLNNSKYGIAYVDSTEHITQLNRSVDNNLTKRAEDLTSMLYNQLNMSTGVLDGTANDATMLNYQNRTIRPIADAIVDEFNRKWISQTAYTQGHRIRYFNDPFKVMSVAQIAESADKLTRNEIMTSNEVRDKIGLKPSMDPNADELRNKNINSSSDTSGSMPVEPTGQEEETGDYGGYNLYNE
jgi:HK97 family phage portal protein